MKILIIEDEKKLANALKIGLENKGFFVDLCFDGAQGKQIALSTKYDLFIVDRMLPNIGDGLQIVKACQNAAIKTPIIVLTARGTIDEKVEGLNIGADDYIAKPFAFKELVARINVLLRRPQDTKETNLINYNCFTVNFDTKEITKDKEMLELSKKEFELLSYFILNAEKIVSKTEICTNVWSEADDISENNVEVYVRYLRKKIDSEDGEQSYIKTIRGFGYKFSNK